MTYRELVKSLAGLVRLPQTHVDAVLFNLVRLVPTAAKTGPVRVAGLGTFRVRTRKGRRIRNPVTKELQHLPASVTLGFSPAKVAKVRVAR